MYCNFMFYELLVFETVRGKVNIKMEETALLLNYLHYSGLQILKRRWILIGNSD